MNNISFEINPLDINIAQIQHKLISKFNVEILRVEKFEPVVEVYESKDPTLDLSDISVSCRQCNDNVEIVINLFNKNKTKSYEQIIFRSTKQAVFEYLNSAKYFTDVKSFVYESIKRK